MSLFSREHYIFLASVMRDAKHCENTKHNLDSYVDETIEILARALQSQSPGFDRQRFIDDIYNPREIQETPNLLHGHMKSYPITPIKTDTKYYTLDTENRLSLRFNLEEDKRIEKLLKDFEKDYD